MGWPSGSLGLVGDFDPRIIPRGGSKKYLSAWSRRCPRFRCLAAAGGVYDEPRTSVSATDAKTCRKPSPNLAPIWIDIFLNRMYLRLTGQKKVGRIGLSVPREGFRRSSYSSRRLACYFEFLLYAAPIALRCWKHSR